MEVPPRIGLWGIRCRGVGPVSVLLAIPCYAYMYFKSSVQDEITGETIAIKLITRVFDKVQLSKRALREITLLRHFNNHDNVSPSLPLPLAIASRE